MTKATRQYARLTDPERFHLMQSLGEGHSLRWVAKKLGRSPSTLSREVKRNTPTGGRHCHAVAGDRARERRKRQVRHPALTPAMRERAHADLRERQWSPEQICGRTRAQGGDMVCAATLYRHIRARRAAGDDLHTHLRHGGRRRKRRGVPETRGRIPDRVGIEARPSIVDARTRLGDWEADLIIGKGHKGAVVTLLERRTGLYLAAPIPNKSADVTAAAIVRLLRPYKAWVRTVTFDNGREFTRHGTVARRLDCETYFARPYHSWERGANENANGLLRQYLPKAERLDRITRREVQAAVDAINHRPRKRLGWNTPAEALATEQSRIGQQELWYKPEAKTKEVLR